MSKKIRVGVLFGGKSAEHEISLMSARNIMQALDPTRYEIIPVAIDRNGRWFAGEKISAVLKSLESPGNFDFSGEQATIVPWKNLPAITSLKADRPGYDIDVIFPVLHGTFGEDGTVQGLLKLADIPFAGCDVLASAAAMDKIITKRLLNEAGIDNARFETIRKGAEPDIEAIIDRLGLPLFVKPANMGSSVGITMVAAPGQLADALDKAFCYDTKAVIEEKITGREIECAVLGNTNPEASVPGEIVPMHDYYSYEAKYLDDRGAKLKIPAELDDETAARVRALAVRAFKALCCEGMARVDFFLQPDGRLLVNEINTIPGFTRISMYPKLWEASGLPYSKLLDRLIELAMERHRERTGLSFSK